MENKKFMFENFIGQEQNVNNLKVFIKAALLRSEPLDHVLITGPSGMGKTHLSKVIATALDKKIVYTNGSNFYQPSDVISVVSKLTKDDILFIDEIHGINSRVQEVFYSIMEDKRIDIIVGMGNDKRNISFPIEEFTIIGATNNPGKLKTPFYNRFPIKIKMNSYEFNDFKLLIHNYKSIYKVKIYSRCDNYLYDVVGANPRQLKYLIKRIADFKIDKMINLKMLKELIKSLGYYQNGITIEEIEILKTIYFYYKDRPTGLNKLCQVIDIDLQTYSKIYEPRLIKGNYITSTPRGRILSKKAIKLIREFEYEH